MITNNKNYSKIFLIGGTGAIDISIEYLLKGAENTTKGEKGYINTEIKNVDKGIKKFRRNFFFNY
ncbi:hypothetical protein GCM10008905_18340 [Clostridium malenominatum]|uniref:Uncharacterized protein n=1 Tax=Clostridium malenominatum TaxID=1539 RepID=A0ABN1IZB2_9CLOT